jgi:predicted transcriptional regulator
MKSLKTLITEQKNTHMYHVEELVFNEGVDGARKAINFLRDLRDMLSGNANSKVQATVKWDGAPAIFCGIDPTDKKFFVAKKGVFNKNPKVYKTPQEIDADTSGELAQKLKVALTELSKLGITSGVYQGDLMFTNDKKREKINGVDYITFHPNTIVYAVPATSALGQKIQKAKIGVVWHTVYTGRSFETMKATFGQNIVRKFRQSPTVWMDDANYKDYSGTATFTKRESDALTAILSSAGSLFHQIKAPTLNAIKDNPELNQLINTFNNKKVREGEKIVNPRLHTQQLFHYIHDRYEMEIDKRKTDKGKQGQRDKRQAILKFFADHDQAEIARIFELVNLLADAKQMIIDKMNEAGHLNTFLRTPSGFKVTNVEGFVAIDHLTGGAVKIVDRMEFSRSNFSPDIIKGWQK